MMTNGVAKIIIDLRVIQLNLSSELITFNYMFKKGNFMSDINNLIKVEQKQIMNSKY